MCVCHAIGRNRTGSKNSVSFLFVHMKYFPCIVGPKVISILCRVEREKAKAARAAFLSTHKQTTLDVFFGQKKKVANGGAKARRKTSPVSDPVSKQHLQQCKMLNVVVQTV